MTSAYVRPIALAAGERKGKADLLESSNGVCGDPIEFIEGDAGSLDRFGSAVACDGTAVLLGAPGEQASAKAAPTLPTDRSRAPPAHTTPASGTR